MLALVMVIFMFASGCGGSGSDETATPSPATAAWFREQPLDVNTWRTFDLGAVDFDADGDLDLFTTNHHSQQSILANDGQGGFRKVTSELGLDFDLSFPGWEQLADGPCPGGGLSIYRKQDLFAVEFVPTAAMPQASGTFGFVTAVRTADDENVEVTVTGDEGETSPHTVRFSFGEKGRFTMRAEHLSLPLEVTLGENVPLGEVRVGAQCVLPTGNPFTLRITDRHGMGWADYNADGNMDLAAAAGGLRADIDLFSPYVRDELFEGRDGRLRDVIAGSGLTKNGCRGRQAEWVEIDADGRLDLALTCYGGALQLYRQEAPGRFARVNDAVGLGGALGDTMAWADLDGDMRRELITETQGGVDVFRRDDQGRFAEVQRLALPDEAERTRRDERVRKLALSDFDTDGDADFFLASAGGSHLLVNDGRRLQRVDPASVGLPDKAVMAQWVDYDNDGLLDLHAVPGGLYRQGGDGRFSRTTVLDGIVGSGVDEARTQWVDLDNDGRRDLVVSTADEDRADLRDFETRRYTNVGTAGHWLEVDLEGPPGARDAIGAVVRARVGDRVVTRWVGEADGAVFSQGHRRVYFGLGDNLAVTGMEVVWADGVTQPVTPDGVDRVLRVVRAG